MKYKEMSFPVNYRQAEVKRILGALGRLRSIAVTGMAGMGKSNVIRFIASHPQVRERYLGACAADWVFVHVDCAGLAASTEDEILNEIALQLLDQRISRGVVPTDSAVRPPFGLSLTDPAGSTGRTKPRRTLKRRILDLGPGTNLAVILDYFDPAAAELDASFFNFLVHLRNSRPQANLAYVFATRRPMKHLCELQELLDEPCVVGPLGTGDALGSIGRDEARLGVTFTPAQRDLLFACTGGHPGLLKNACELLGSAQVSDGRTKEEFVRQLLDSSKISNLCDEVWRDLTPAEQHVLINVARDAPLLQNEYEVGIAFLAQYGLLVLEKPDRPRASIFCPLFAAFVRTRSAVASAVRITAVFPNQAQLAATTGGKRITLSPKLFALLRALVESRGQVIPTDELIVQVYGDEAPGVTNAALSQLVKRLRGTLDPSARQLTGDPTFTSVETVRDVGYRLCG